VPRGNQYDQKKYNVEVVLVYNQSSYYGSYKGTPFAISDASRLTGTATFETSINHNITAGQTVTVTGITPS